MTMKTVFEIYNSHVQTIPRQRTAPVLGLFEEAQAKKVKKQSKYRNEWVVIDGLSFQSIGEGNYYLELKSRQQRGDIREFKRQVPFEFFVNGIRVGKYICDFVTVLHDGTIEVIDYKSRFTITLQLYEIKRALMQACYGVIIKEVGAKRVAMPATK